MHGLRVAMFAAIVLLIRQQHSDLMSRSAAARARSSPPSLATVRRIFPSAERLASQGDQWKVLASNGKPLGVVLQTSPASDSIVGFSGSTNVLLGLAPDGTLVGATILSSGDTAEHVRQIARSRAFWAQFRGLRSDAYARVAEFDGVSGATLTSMAILEGIYRRLGGRPVSLRFPAPPSIDLVRQHWPDANRIVAPDHPHGLWRAVGTDDRMVGWILRTSPAADRIVGYQGPTDTLVFLNDGLVVEGIAVDRSYDNLPYVDYVREDRFFNRLLDRRSLDQLAQMDVESAGIEGVSGATMTSVAVAQGVFSAARRSVAASQARPPAVRFFSLSVRDVGTVLVVLSGILIAFTRLRGQRWIRFAYQAVVIGYLGLTNGDLLSLAQMAGWSRNGIPWRSATGLVILSAAALSVPMFTGRNFYCNHMCPHGALQQWIRPRRRRWHVPGRLHNLLRCVPAVLLLVAVVATVAPLPLNLVHIEPFHAWVFRIAGWGTIVVAIAGLAASLFVPMAYCRYGCPTGAILGYMRFTSHSDRWGPRDWFVLGLVGLALTITWVR